MEKPSAIALRIWLVMLMLLLRAASIHGQVVDATSLTNKILAGYQGWFCAPGDGNDPVVGWNHWSHSVTDIGPGLYNTDLWPDVGEFDAEELFPAPHVTLLDSSTGQLFSSRTLKTTQRHFKWMRENGIDGVMLQRFIASFGGPYFLQRNKVLENVSNAAATHGRVYVIEYDISGENTSTVYNHLTQDWKYLVDTYHPGLDARYLHHNGKPVVAIWGLGFNDRAGTPAIATQIINFFKTDPVYGGNYMIGGVPEGWRTLTGSSLTDPAWANVYRSWDAISPWTVGRYSNTSGVNSFKTNFIVPDLRACNSLGIGYLPVFWPGFSWDNLQHYPPGTSNIPRNGGQFFWDQASAFQSAGLSMMKVAMFDEMDEGTAILKISQNHPVTDNWVDYGTLPNDWYMRLAGAATRMLRKEIPLTGTLPIDPVCNGDEASFNLGEDVADRMTHPQVSDGDTVVTSIGGVSCRKNVAPSTDLYMYFAVADGFAYQGSRHELCVTIDYYETGGSTGSLHLQYDSDTGNTLAAMYKDGGSVTLGLSNTWKRKIFHITDAYFGNRQNGGTDFRIALFKTGGGTFYLDQVLVASTVPKPAQIQLGPTTLAHSIIKGKSVPPDKVNIVNMGVAPLNYLVSSNAGWLSVTPGAGRSTGEVDVLTVAYDTAGLTTGHYTATITAVDPSASNSPQTTSVTLDVIAFGDLDLDGDVDLSDFGLFQRCLSGSMVSMPPQCLPADSNGDNSIDSVDFAQFLLCMKGPDKPPGC